jgi:hypothetical protein
MNDITPIPPRPSLFASRGFVAAFVVLLVAAGGLNFAASYLQLHFRKEPVPMRVSFTTEGALPVRLGNWVQVLREETLSPDLLAALATDQYFFGTYLDAGKLGQTPEQLRQEFADKSPADQKGLVGQYRQRNPHAVLEVACTYYTGKADTVAHIPERCYVGDGFDPVNPEKVRWGLDRDLYARYISFENKRNVRAPLYNVAYFFYVNGGLTDDSFTVRTQLQDLFNRYGYYAKVELLCVSPDREQAALAMQDFLGQALPKIEADLPDWSQWSGRKSGAASPAPPDRQ